MLKNKATLLLLLLLSLFSISNLQAQCPGPDGPSRWVWSPVEIFDISSLPAQAAYFAAQGWNNIQNNISLEVNSFFYDIVVINNTGMQVAGRTTPHTQLESSCNGYRDLCGQCMNFFVMLQAGVEVNPNIVVQVAAQVGTDYLTASAGLLAHEFGHALRLDHIVQRPGDDCPQVQSTMYDCLACTLFCGRAAPQIPCDSNAIYTLYPYRIGAWCDCSGIPC